jgi:competence protein ComEC
MSAVIRIHLGGSAIALLAGDLDVIGLEILESSGAEMTAPVLVFPHHGGLPGTTDLDVMSDFTERITRAVDPETIIFSISRTKYTNPHPAIVAAALAAKPGIHIACTQLSTRCSPESLLAGGHLSSRFSLGRARGHCCAGSMVLRPGFVGVSDPTREAHLAAISLLDARLCR